MTPTAQIEYPGDRCTVAQTTAIIKHLKALNPTTGININGKTYMRFARDFGIYLHDKRIEISRRISKQDASALISLLLDAHDAEACALADSILTKKTRL